MLPSTHLGQHWPGSLTGWRPTGQGLAWALWKTLGEVRNSLFLVFLWLRSAAFLGILLLWPLPWRLLWPWWISLRSR